MAAVESTRQEIELVAAEPSIPTPAPLLAHVIGKAGGWGRFTHEYWREVGCNPAKAPLVALQHYLSAASSMAHTPVHALVVVGEHVRRVTPHHDTAPGTGYRLPLVIMLQLHADASWRALGIRSVPRIVENAEPSGEALAKPAPTPVHASLQTLHAMDEAASLMKKYAETLRKQDVNVTQAAVAAASSVCRVDSDEEEDRATQRAMVAAARGEDSKASAAAQSLPNWWPSTNA